MSDSSETLVGILLLTVVVLFFVGTARAAGNPVRSNRRKEDGPYSGPWGILESRKRDPDLEWDEIAIMDDEIRHSEEEASDWLDEPGDEFGSGWTNFDYIAANELEDEWSEE